MQRLSHNRRGRRRKLIAASAGPDAARSASLASGGFLRPNRANILDTENIGIAVRSRRRMPVDRIRGLRRLSSAIPNLARYRVRTRNPAAYVVPTRAAMTRGARPRTVAALDSLTASYYSRDLPRASARP